MIKKETLVIGSCNEIVDYFRNELHVALKPDQVGYEKQLKALDVKLRKCKTGPERSSIERKMVKCQKLLSQECLKYLGASSRELGDESIEAQLDSILVGTDRPHFGLIFYLQGSFTEAPVDAFGTPEINLTLTSVYVRVLSADEIKARKKHERDFMRSLK